MYYSNTQNVLFPVTISTSGHRLQLFSAFVKLLMDVVVVVLAGQVADLRTAATVVPLSADSQHVGYNTHRRSQGVQWVQVHPHSECFFVIYRGKR